jgi:hypothetical protein
MGDLDNTLIIWSAGDNGPSPEGGLNGIFNKMTYYNGFTESIEELVKRIDEFGGPTSHGANPAAWGYATSAPFTYGKMVTSGGGCSTAAVISWPARIKDKGGFRRQFHHLIDVVPTILECVGVPEPKRVNGVDQMPMAGVSMVYTFDDAKAKDRHTTQYFEMTGSRAMYQDGWWAGTRHGLDGVTAAQKDPVPFDKDVWELYDLRTDFGHATDLAAKYPEKLKELQALFDREARKYNVYPMANNPYELYASGRPAVFTGDKAIYSPADFRFPEETVISIKNRSFSIDAEVENPNGNAEGMIVTCGGATAGYALLVEKGKPTFYYNFFGLELTAITSSEPLPKGSCTVRFNFAYDGGGVAKGGTGTLSVNGKKVAEGRIARTVPIKFATDDGFDVGQDLITPVSPTYKCPFKFTGTVKKVTIERQPLGLSPEQEKALEEIKGNAVNSDRGG